MNMTSPRFEASRPVTQAGPVTPAGPVRRRLDPTEVDGSPHAIERQVCRVLKSHPGLSISSLVVRRLGDGVCLSGVVESTDDPSDVCRLARQVAGVNEVINRLLVRSVNSN